MLAKGTVFPEEEEEERKDASESAAPPKRPLPGELAVVQWETACFYTHERDASVVTRSSAKQSGRMQKSHLSIGVTRLGHCGGKASVRWRTFDISAVAGKHYAPVHNQLIEFQDGETHKDLIVQVIPCDEYDGTVEFGVYLEAETAENCDVGHYLHTASIKIIDDACFPTEVLRDEVEGGNKERINNIPPNDLMREFRVSKT